VTTKNRAFDVGLIVGVVLIGSVCWVYLHSYDLSVGGIALALFGLILISLSVWRNIDLSVNEKGITAKFEQFAAEVKAETSAAKEKVEKTEHIALVAVKSIDNLKQSIDIRNAQAVLSAAGYSVFADGLLGPQTISVIKQFQKEKGIAVTGELDRETMLAMKLYPMN
jgi:hypothetical protein